GARRHRPAGLDAPARLVRMSRRDRCERSDATSTDARCLVHDALDVLGKIVATADDDHLLSATADEELSVRQVSKVARGEPAVSNESATRVRPAHVAPHHGGPGHEDLADNAFTDRLTAAVHHADRMVGEWPAATDEA